MNDETPETTILELIEHIKTGKDTGPVALLIDRLALGAFSKLYEEEKLKVIQMLTLDQKLGMVLKANDSVELDDDGFPVEEMNELEKLRIWGVKALASTFLILAVLYFILLPNEFVEALHKVGDVLKSVVKIVFV